MTGSADRDASSKIQEGVSIHVGDHHAFGFGGHQWIGTTVGRRNVLSVLSEDSLGSWAWERRRDFDPGVLGHNDSNSQKSDLTEEYGELRLSSSPVSDPQRSRCQDRKCSRQLANMSP